ncbi:hypothetical protein ACET3X_003483 [Alternaria dauci]|uniref:Uncharacterized protein n=1 Tax=Alternaria dauci TaxID=48095 RepID=A0ABR3UVK8_9PLEO
MTSDWERQQAAAKCDEIIRFKPHGAESSYHNHQSARAEPNGRLKQVFGIDNGFTNPNPASQKPFIRKAENLMLRAMNMKSSDSMEDEDWSSLRSQAINFFEEYMNRKSDETVNLAELTQYIVLRQSLCYLFEGAAYALRNEDVFDDITFIGRRINELWIESKTTSTISADELTWEKETDLHNALRRVTMPPMSGSFYGQFPIVEQVDPETPASNPMNLLLPAYETMWRIVLRCFLEVKHRGAHQGSVWTTVLLQYLEDLKDAKVIKPTAAFHRFTENGTNKVRPVEIVKEALRLYPPTRRVHRMFDGEAQSADIEGCQRSGLLGDTDPLIFIPERWQSICEDERQAFYGIAAQSCTQLRYKNEKDRLRSAETKQGYMPFGYFCAADHSSTKEFASKMIALLVAVLCHGLGDQWELEDPGSLPSTTTPLDSDRAAYEGLRLKRRG